MTRLTNLLILLSDNHNRALAGCYGHPQATPPNLDRIAAREGSLVFTPPPGHAAEIER